MTQKQAVINSLLSHQPVVELPSAQQLAWLMVRPICFLEQTDRQILRYVCQD
ncbi:hypothetical protein GO755_25495 [Spirosoma sp. HMF4905]|uniref:Uncharacterized protein n=1 Tax=Spirosoma arboris TaxID=2682092 RepID=A0A7K1SI74_9BACT|nr:hypothetical protein [Spirosoma arboris]MVM33418.1 hypothetical protein [Spirosoma arboris]